MKVKCILSHEKPMGKVIKKGSIHELDEFDKKFFRAVREKKAEKEEFASASPRNDKQKKRKRKIRLR